AGLWVHDAAVAPSRGPGRGRRWSGQWIPALRSLRSLGRDDGRGVAVGGLSAPVLLPGLHRVHREQLVSGDLLLILVVDADVPAHFAILVVAAGLVLGGQADFQAVAGGDGLH